MDLPSALLAHRRAGGRGGRTCHSAAARVSTRTFGAGYGTVATEFQRGMYALRLEVRDNTRCCDSPVSSLSKSTNDLTVTLGLACHTAMR